MPASWPGGTLDGMRTLSLPTLGLLVDSRRAVRQPDQLGTSTMRCDFLKTGHGDEIVRALQNILLGTRTAAEPEFRRRTATCCASPGSSRRNAPTVCRGGEKRLRGPLLRLRGHLRPRSHRATTPPLHSCRCGGRVPWPPRSAPWSTSSRRVATTSRSTPTGRPLRPSNAQRVRQRPAQERAGREVMRLAEDHTSYVRPAKAGDGTNAISYLRTNTHLAGGDGERCSRACGR